MAAEQEHVAQLRAMCCTVISYRPGVVDYLTMYRENRGVVRSLHHHAASHLFSRHDHRAVQTAGR